MRSGRPDGGPQRPDECVLAERLEETLHGALRQQSRAKGLVLMPGARGVFPTLTQQRLSVSNAAGWESGRLAADRACLQPRREMSAS